MATAIRSDSSSPTFLMWWTVPRGTHTRSSLVASITVPPVSSHCRRPARMTHHSSKSLCQCGRLPLPGPLAISVTRFLSSWSRRTDHGGGPIFSTTSPMRVCSMLGHDAFTTRGGMGPLTTSVMLSWVAGSTGVVMLTTVTQPECDGLSGSAAAGQGADCAERQQQQVDDQVQRASDDGPGQQQ